MSLIAVIPALPVNCTTRSIDMTLRFYTFSLSLGTFLFISNVRNLAIRKPFVRVTHKAVYLVLAGWNLFSSVLSVLVFFIYEPAFTSSTFSAFTWSFTGISMTFMVISNLILNSWSKKILAKQSRMRISGNEVEMRRRKRNKTAVAILNIISFIYALCVLPLSIHFVLIAVLTWMQKDSIFPVLRISYIVTLPLFPCSGLNALVYMLKDKNIRRFYKRYFCCRKGI